MPFKNPHPLYSLWANMKSRCLNRSHRSFHRYGGRGITICDKWLEPNGRGFRNFVSDLGERPPNHTLDRINNDKGYSPENCRWSSKKEQQRNMSCTKFVEVQGKQYKAIELAEIAGLKMDTIVERAKLGLPYKEVVSSKRRVFTEGLKLGAQASAKSSRSKTHCSNGHKFTKANTSITKEGWRRCKTCHREKEALRRKSA